MSIASGQRIGAGLKIGALLSDPFSAPSISTAYDQFTTSIQYLPSNPRTTLGPMVELRLPHGWDVEASALYRRVQYATQTRTRDTTPGEILPFDATVRIETRARNLDFPVLIKHRFSNRVVRPFIGAGAAARWVFGVERHVQTSSGPASVPASLQQAPELDRTWTAGFVAAAGIEWRIQVLRIAPELRYSRWANPAFRDAHGGWFSLANQLDFLLSVGF